MKIKICIILFFLVILSCQKKGEIPDNNEPEKAAELKEQKHNTAPQITIKDIEGYHIMDGSTIIKLIVEDEIVKVQTLFWKDNSVKYTDAIVLEFTKENLNYSDKNNAFNFEISERRPDYYYLVIKIGKKLMYSYYSCYEYLGKNITDEIINAVSGKQDEYTGKYVFSRMESKETMETFLRDNNLQLEQKTAEDFKNSYITIKLGGNGKYIIEPSEKLIRSLIFMESGEIFAYNTSSSTGVHFYYSAGVSLKQSEEIIYSFNNNKELVVFIEVRNAAKYSGEYEVLIEDEKINEYNFFYKR
jgi:hypothetical protein